MNREKINQIVSRTDVSGNERAELITEFTKQFALQVATEAVEEEPELEGEMPDEMFEAIKNDRGALIEAFRITVRQTKEGILKNIKKRLDAE